MSKTPTARADRLLANLGYGSRREVQALIESGAVTLDGERLGKVGFQVPIGPALAERMRVRGRPLDPPAPLTLVMNKPAGLVCSHREPGRSVYDLLPARWRARDPALSTIGRLDIDTTGLLLITDDGAFLHRVISPRSKVAKRYRATLARPMSGDEAALFASGTLILDGDSDALAPAILLAESPTEATLTITEGRYHQVRRMFAAAGNHVTTLHRECVGGLEIPSDIALGGWRVAVSDETARCLTA